MEFGLDKCAKAPFKRGKKVAAEGVPLNDKQVLQDLNQAETYNYPGREEGEGVQHHEMKKENQASAEIRTECKE